MQYQRFEALFDAALARAHAQRQAEDTLRGYDESVGAAQAILALHKALLNARMRGGSAMWAEDNLVLRTLGGSRAYGLTTPHSDMDQRGVALWPFDMLTGIVPGTETFTSHAPVDVVVHTLGKVTRLALTANPNIWEILFCREDAVLFQTEVGRDLRQHREWFLSRRAAQSYAGYAAAQLAHMRNHNSEQGARAERFHRYGYDTKNAMHLIRLLRMAREVLADGAVHVYRPDREELLAIRHGAYTALEIQKMARDLNAACQALVPHSPLQSEPNTEAVHTWLLSIYRRWAQDDPSLLAPLP